jgi:broad specificity phosphatase PhoE
MFGVLVVSADLVVELVPHCSAVAREGWVGDHDGRPLTALGHRQAAALAVALAADGDLRMGIDAVYSSPALRCRQSVAPVAAAAGLDVGRCAELHETREFQDPPEWVSGLLAPIGPPVGGAWAAGRAVRALAGFAAEHPGGRVVASSHGDVIPVLLSFLAAAFAQPLPRLGGRGGWYRLRLADGALTVTGHAVTN